MRSRQYYTGCFGYIKTYIYFFKLNAMNIPLYCSPATRSWALNLYYTSLKAIQRR